VGVAPLSVPQAGEQAAPAAVRVQVTPALFASFFTDAWMVSADTPASMLLILFVIETEIKGDGEGVMPVPLEHPAIAAAPISRAAKSQFSCDAPTHQVCVFIVRLQ
jgi:hypothetical protein